MLSPVFLEIEKDFIFQSFRVGVIPKWLDEIRWSVSISLVDGDHPQTPASNNSLQQYGQLKCLVVVPSPSGRKLCSLLLTSHIAKGIRIVTLQESTRIVYTTVPRPLFVQPVIVNDVTTKVLMQTKVGDKEQTPCNMLQQTCQFHHLQQVC